MNMTKLKPILTVVGAAFGLGIMASYGWYRLQLRPVDRHEAIPINFTVEAGEGSRRTASRLQTAGLIRSDTAFMIFITVHGLRSQLQAGVYSFNPSQSASEIARKMANGEIDQRRFTVPEGYTIKQIIDLAVKQGFAKTDLEAAMKASYPQTILQERPAGAGLEGYLFPDTYQISPNASAKELVGLMIDNFSNKLTPQLKAELAARSLTLHQAVTLASIVEKEAGRDADRPQIAQVFLLRLKIGMKLDSDVTVQYGGGIEAKDQLATVAAIKNLDSPFNTYKNAGLPPGPIGNPGLAAFEAVARPAAGDYLYFVADRSGITHFARTATEHEDNVQKYLRQ
jgi:UPF0755 protein